MPWSARFRDLFAAFGPAQRRQFWQATGIDINKQSVNEEKLGEFKGSLSAYREHLAKSIEEVDRAPVKAPALSNHACSACGRVDQQEIYIGIPKCGEFCVQCIEELIRDAGSAA